MVDRKRILTGHRPTGPRHLGHLVGTLRTWANMQDDYQCFFLVADLHVLTTDFLHSEQIAQNTLDVLTDWLAAGIDYNRSTLVLQSAIPEHSQLCVLLAMLTSVSRLERVPTYKEQVQQLSLQPSLGLLTYPVLQAADILLYRAEGVPVGEDQLPHVELAREIVRRFNQIYGVTFPEPEAILSLNPRLPGIDNRSMHTSYGNAIYIKDTPDETTRKISSMYTDPTRIHATDPGHVHNNPLFAYLDAFDPDLEKVKELKELYSLGRIGDVAVKHYLAEVINRELEPIRQRRSELSNRKGEIIEALRTGTIEAQTYARQTLADAQEKMGLNLSAYWKDISLHPADIHLVGSYC
jgi:tryptophanyl-tRNA synthetase